MSTTPMRIIASYGHQFLALTLDKRTDMDASAYIQLVARGKKQGYAVGDIVNVTPTSNNQGAIESLQERRNHFYRSEFNKQKNLAANIDQVAIVCATEPAFSEELLGRALICAEVAEIEVLIILNKVDVSDKLASARATLSLYPQLGYPLIEVSSKQADSLDTELKPHLAGKTTLLMGQSGMGKSSLINALIPDVQLKTREISSVLNSGKHTTTFTRLFDCDINGQASDIIDSPGFEQFGMAQFSLSQIQHAMPEFKPYLGQCRFHNCKHLQEPQCAVLAAIAEGQITEKRHQFYLRLMEQLDYYDHARY
ncbi:ribosome small subunit-dependent GTPase A [Hydromonas duriensis]|uniref:Small ribosomal subunit biogenesis GTPase RsgA n=1 Tax=Hydromonas duriensis TaxID=1527608 RepID=A0A4R6YA43_9BURK|nr:ribosome small subunit-dependent GTPase A [Hydromonas duriensis]TDR32403.1 ribosome biogenesis GTPase [Hydromonas duriensis]